MTCSHPELTKDHVLTSAFVRIFRNAINKSIWRKKDCSWLLLNKHAMNIFIQTRTGARFSENQSAPKLENRKTSPCSPHAPNLLHVLPSRMVGWNELCNPAHYLSSFFRCIISFEYDFFKPGLLILAEIWNSNISKCCAIWSKRRQIPKLVFGVRTVPSKFLQISADYNEDDETRSILTIL